MENPLPTILDVVLISCFIGMWCSICLFLSMLGGWNRLAKIFRTPSAPSGKRFVMQSGRVGLVNYSGCLTIYSSSEGLYLSVWFLFRLGHSPLFIPWDAVHNAKARKFLWFERVTFDVGQPRIATIELSRQVFTGCKTAVK